MKRLGLLIVCTACVPGFGDADGNEPVMTLVKGHECMRADRVAHLPEGVFPPRFPYNELVLTSYWVPAGATDAHSPVFVTDCRHAGFLIDSRSLPFRNQNPARGPREPEWNNPHAQYHVTWQIPDSSRFPPATRHLLQARNPGRLQASSPAIRPWADPRGSPELVIETTASIPTAETVGEHAHVQLNLAFYLLDTANGKFFSYVVNLYEHPYRSHSDTIANDFEFAFVSARMPPDSTPELERPFFRRSPRSRGSDATRWPEPRFFRIHVGREHILRALKEVNTHIEEGGGGFSTNPADYLLAGAGLIQETVYRRGESLVMGTSFSDFAVYVARKNGVRYSSPNPPWTPSPKSSASPASPPA